MCEFVTTIASSTQSRKQRATRFWRSWPAQGEADYLNRAEMQRRGVAIAKIEGKYEGRARSHDYAAIKAWRAEHGASIRETAEKFGVGTATVKRACAE